MKNFKFYLAAVLIMFSYNINADVPNRFTNGESISAAEFNENFSSLNAEIENLRSRDTEDDFFLVTRTVEVNNGLVDNPIYQNNTSNNVNLRGIVYKKAYGRNSGSVDLLYDGNILPSSRTPTKPGQDYVIATVPPGGSINGVVSESTTAGVQVILLMEVLD